MTGRGEMGRNGKTISKGFLEESMPELSFKGGGRKKMWVRMAFQAQGTHRTLGV